MARRWIHMAGLLSVMLPGAAWPGVVLAPADEPAGYVARLIINETAFPGERGYVGEQDSMAAMRSLVLVLDSRINRVPPGYRREEIADTASSNVIDIITAGGFHGQMDGFYRDAKGRAAMAPRVSERVGSLVRIANSGEPGRFARLLNYAQSLASAYVKGAVPSPDLFADVRTIPPRRVTGNAYGWMTDADSYRPGGDFVRIPDRLRGRLGGNRFFALSQRAGSAAQPPSGGALVRIKK